MTPEQPRTVLFIDDFPHLGGAQVALLRLMRKLPAARYRPEAVCPGPGHVRDQLDQYDIPRHIVDLQTLKARPWQVFRIWRELAAVLDQVEPDVVVANSLWATLIVEPLTLRRRTPLLLSLHAFPVIRTWWKRWGFKLFAGLMIRQVDHIFVVSEALGEAASRVFGGWRKMVLVPNGVEVEDFRDLGSVETRPLPETWPDDAFVIGHFGRFHDGKGQMVAVQALEYLKEDLPNARMMLVGDDCEVPLDQGGYRDALTQRIQWSFIDHTEDDPVWMPGFVTSLRETLALMSRCDVVILPSFQETFGLTLIEAGMLGLPVVASDVGGIPEVVRDGYNGLLVEPGDPKVLALALRTLAQDPEYQRELGDHAKELVLARFTMEHVVRTVVRIFDEVLAKA